MDAVSDELLRERVERGAEYLDEDWPDWPERIDLETLDLNGGDRCVLGQLFGGFREGREILGLSLAVTRVLGFNYEARTNLDWIALYPGGRELARTGAELEAHEAERLRVLWIEQVSKRRA
jgi:hypothetical protein